MPPDTFSMVRFSHIFCETKNVFGGEVDWVSALIVFWWGSLPVYKLYIRIAKLNL